MQEKRSSFIFSCSAFVCSLCFSVLLVRCEPPVTASFRSLCTFSLNMFGSRESFTKRLLNSNALGIELPKKPNEHERAGPPRARGRNRADVPSRRFSPYPVGARRTSPPFSNMAPASCCSAAKMEPRAYISRVLIKGCKCLEAV